MTKTRTFSHNGRHLEVQAVEGRAGWVVRVLDETGLTVSTTGSIPRWVGSDGGSAANGQVATVDALMERVVTDVTGGRLPLLPSF